jgi:hypothetical protein
MANFKPHETIKKSPATFNFNRVDSPTSDLGAIYNIDDKTLNQPSKLLLARAAA